MIYLSDILGKAKRVPGLFRSGVEEVKEQSSDLLEEIRRKREEEEKKKRGLVAPVGEGVEPQRAQEVVRKPVSEPLAISGTRGGAKDLLTGLATDKDFQQRTKRAVSKGAQQAATGLLSETGTTISRGLRLGDEKSDGFFDRTRSKLASEIESGINALEEDRQSLFPADTRPFSERLRDPEAMATTVTDLLTRQAPALALGGASKLGGAKNLTASITGALANAPQIFANAFTTSKLRLQELNPDTPEEEIEDIADKRAALTTVIVSALEVPTLATLFKTNPNAAQSFIRSISKRLAEVSVTEVLTENAQDFASAAIGEVFGEEVDIKEVIAQIPETTVLTLLTSGLLAGGREIPGAVVRGVQRGDISAGLSIENVGDDLIQEARKYKSAEEFVEAYNKDLLVHGSPTEIKGGKFQLGKNVGGQDAGGVFFADNTRTGQLYAKAYTTKGILLSGKKPGKVYTAKLKPGTKIFDASNPEHIKQLAKKAQPEVIDDITNTTTDGVMDWATGSQYFDTIEEAGFDGARMIEREKGTEIFDETGRLIPSPDNIYSTAVFNPEKADIVEPLTKSQLTDIYNQAKEADQVPQQETDPVFEQESIRNLLDPESQKVYKVLTTVDQSEKGERIFTPQRGTMDLLVDGKESSFPQWISESLRLRTLIDQVMENLEAGRIPEPGSRVGDLYLEIQNRINREIGIEEEFPMEQAYAQQQRGDTIENERVKQIQTLLEKVRNIKQPKVSRTSVDRSFKNEQRVVTMTEKTALKTRLRNIAAGARVAKVETKRAIKQAQTEMVQVVEEFLPQKDRAKFIRTIKNIQSQEHLDKKMPEVIERIETLIEKNNKRILTDKISKELKSARVKKQGGKPVGKFTADAQDKLDRIQEIVSEDRTVAQQKILDTVERARAEERPLTTEEIAENELLSLAGVKQQDSESLQETLATIQSVKETGKTMRELERFNRQTELERVKPAIVDEISGGKGVKKVNSTGIPDKDMDSSTLKKHLNVLGNWLQGWDTMMEKLSLKPSKRQFEGVIFDYSERIKDARTQKNESFKQVNGEIVSSWRRIYNVKNKQDAKRLVDENTEELSLGTFKNTEGDSVELIMSQNQAYKKWQQLQDPSLEPTFDAMGWTQEMKQAVEDYLTPETKAWAQWQIDEFHPRYYEGINNVYRQKYGASLPKNPHYSGQLFREGIDTDIGVDTLMLRDAREFLSPKPGSIKSRTSSTRPLAFVDGDQALFRQVAEMEHYKAFELPMTDIKAVFGDGNVRSAIQQYHGKDAVTTVDHLIRNIEQDGKQSAQRVIGLDKLRSNYTKAKIGGNPRVLLKQLTSIPAYLAEMPQEAYGAYFRGLGEFWVNPVENTRTLMESPMMQARYELGDMERDIRTAVNSIDPKRVLTGSQHFTDRLMVSTKIGDRAAILQGGWPVYKYHYDKAIKNGATEAEAKKIGLKKFESATTRTQQSGNPEDLSRIQTTGGSFGKLFTMFMTAPQQYLRAEGRAIRGLARGRGTVAENLTTIAIMQVVLPVLFQFVSDGFEFRKDRQLRSVIIGPLNGIPILGENLESIAAALTGDDIFLGSGPPPLTIGGQFALGLKALLSEGMNAVNGDDVDGEKVAKAVEMLAESIGDVKGVPVGTGIDIMSGTKDLLTDQTDDLRRPIYSPYSLDQEPGDPLLYFPGEVEKGKRESSKVEKVRKDQEEEILESLSGKPGKEQADVLKQMTAENEISEYRANAIADKLVDQKTNNLVKELDKKPRNEQAATLRKMWEEGKISEKTVDTVAFELLRNPREREIMNRETPERAAGVMEILKEHVQNGGDVIEKYKELAQKKVISATVDEFLGKEYADELRKLRSGEVTEEDRKTLSFIRSLFGSEAQAAEGSILDNLGPITAYGSSLWKPGLDIDLAKGDPVPSPVSGVIISTGYNGGFGKQVKVRGRDGNTYWLSHLDGIDVRPGQNIHKGQVIGKGGNTGNVIPGPGGDGSHLDLTVEDRNGRLLTARQVEQLVR